MAINVQIQDRLACMALPVRFDLHVYNDFKKSYTLLLDNVMVRELELDFSWVKYIDSSGLAMLLQLHEHANRVNIPISLLNVFGIALKAFDVANLSSIFNIRPSEAVYINEKRSWNDRREAFVH